MATRVRLTPAPLSGRVVQWKGSYGWIEPTCVVEHPDVAKHRGRIFVHAEDVSPKWKSLTVGSLVEFFLYHDGQGLGAEDCVARKVLRLTLAQNGAQAVFGVEGDRIPEFEAKLGVTLRAYQWMLNDGGSGELNFLLFEVWGRPQNIVEAVLEATKKKDQRYASEMLVPESRLWKVHIGQLQQRCKGASISQDLRIQDPMPCRTLTLKGTREECGSALQTLISQICD